MWLMFSLCVPLLRKLSTICCGNNIRLDYSWSSVIFGEELLFRCANWLGQHFENEEEVHSHHSSHSHE